MSDIAVPGFECEFVEPLPRFVRAFCPICLLVLREPFQVTCCGKSFCRACIKRVRETSSLCPACKQDEFSIFPDKGLKQELHGLKVFCSNKSTGCDWQGELGDLNKHLNSDPDTDRLLYGCEYTTVMCFYCAELFLRLEMEHHQTSECKERPYTCSLCEEYESTYADVVYNHFPECKCRVVECPNSCGINNLQHQHSKEHVSTQCPLSYIECEFSDAGCTAKVYRKDLPSHLEENIVTHMSLLARENRKLKLQLQEQAGLVKKKTVKEKKHFKALLVEQANLVKAIEAEAKKKSKAKKMEKKLGRSHKTKTSRKKIL